MRRSSALSLPPQLVFPGIGDTINLHCIGQAFCGLASFRRKPFGRKAVAGLKVGWRSFGPNSVCSQEL
jgi:hypothetical protein